MSEAYDVLLVDDECENWISTLEPAAEAHECALLGARSVEEGLDLLQNYDTVLDAVLLDLAFPDGGLQGKEGLRQIKEDYPHLPVLILTSSGAAEDIRTAVECVRNGAYDYFPKDRLDPQQLFLQTKQAVEQERREERHQAVTSKATPETDEPCVLAHETDSADSSVRHIRHFALALQSVVRPRGEEEEERAMQGAWEWHRDLLSFLSLWPSDTRFRLRYRTDPVQDDEKRRCHIALIVTVEAETEEKADVRASRIYRELLVFLQDTTSGADPPFHFEPVTSEEPLRQWLVPLLADEGVRLSRSTIAYETSPGGSGMGFGTEPTEDRESEIPGALGDGSMHRYLNHFGRILLQQEAPSVLDVSLRPTKLDPDELNHLRDLARGKGTDGTELSGQEEQVLVEFSETLIQQADRCFEIDIFLAQDQAPVSRTLLAAVERDFFDGVASMEGDSAYLEEVNGLLQALPDESPDASEDRGRLRRLYATTGATELFRLPAPAVEKMPGVRARHPAFDYVPPGLSNEGPILGRKFGQSEPEKVRIHPEDMFQHVYILGQTGTGKTTMLGSMIMERLASGAGMGLIDPHGDLYDRILQVIPERRRDDVVLFDPTDPESDAALNLLEYDPEYPRQRSRLINELFQIFEQEYDQEALGPIFENYMRNALLLVMDDPHEPGTLMDVVRLFQNERYREALLEECDNERVLRFWRQAESTPDVRDVPSPDNVAIYVTSKLSRFIDDDYLRSLINQRRSTIDFRDIIDEGKILLVKMKKGKLGKLGVRMFGTIIVARLMMAALSREDILEEKRRDFFLFVDEFQNFTTPTIASLLAEARKFRLSLTLANQTLYQLDDEIVNAVLGNVGSLVALRPGVKDFEAIEPYVSPPFGREGITNLPNYTAVARLLADSQPTKPFAFRTLPLLDEYLSDGATVG